MKLFAVLLVAVFAGCASMEPAMEPVQYKNPHGNQEQYEKDFKACHFESLKHAQNNDLRYGYLFGRELEQRGREIEIACMLDKGYRVATVEERKAIREQTGK